jgi:hypothetical protein
MVKFWVTLVLTLLLLSWGGKGYVGLGVSPANAQPYYYCDPNDPNCYYNYYSAPYADPFSQFFYYAVPLIEEEQEEREWREHHERQEFEHPQRFYGHHERGEGHGRYEGHERGGRERR